MVSKKKRPPPAIEASDISLKKSKPAETAGTSTRANVMSTAKPHKRIKKENAIDTTQDRNTVAMDGIPQKIAKRTRNSAKAKKGGDEDDDEDDDENAAMPEQEAVQESVQTGIYNFPDWSEDDLLELMKRIEHAIPGDDCLKFQSRVEKIDWETVSFGCHSQDECKETWMKIQCRLRKFRLLRELLEDAKHWVSKPWTNFYRSSKTNRHPDMPRRPLSSYMLFYLEMQDKVASENPGMEMTSISKHIADRYNNLSEKQKQKYTDMAAAQRKEFEEKMSVFYQNHPEVRKRDKNDAKSVGPKKPLAPFKLFCGKKMERHMNEPNFDRHTFLEKCKLQWKNMPDKKKVIWINWACEEEARYTEELKAFKSQNPEFEPGNFKTILTKEERTLRERVAGKPEKPPNSGYSLFSRKMLASDTLKDIQPKERLAEISRIWKNLPDDQKKKYQERVNHMLDQYKLEYATYLESLPEDKKQEELQGNKPRGKKSVQPKTTRVIEEIKNTRSRANKSTKIETTGLCKGEPEPPPSTEYDLFVKTLLRNKNMNYSTKNAPELWQLLQPSDKAQYQKKLDEMKAKYIEDYEKFLNSLTEEELKEYSVRKNSFKKEHVDSSDDCGKEDDSSSSGEDEEEGQDSGSDDSSSESGSNSSDSSESDSKKSDESSSSDANSD